LRPTRNLKTRGRDQFLEVRLHNSVKPEHSWQMAWLALLGLLMAWLVVTLPWVSARRQRAAARSDGADLPVGQMRWTMVSTWTLSAVPLMVCVSFAKLFGCPSSESVTTWSILPFGQVCTFRAPYGRAADVTRPGWTLTILAVNAILGVALEARERFRRRPE
jgi:hypothetical protein